MTPLASSQDGNDIVQVGRSSYGNACYTGLVSYTPVPLVSATDVYVDWERGNRQVLTLTSDVNIYFVNPRDATYHLLIEQQGDWVVTWKVNATDLPVVAWVDGAAPVVTTGGSAEAPIYDTFSFSYWREKGLYVAMWTQNCTVPTA